MGFGNAWDNMNYGSASSLVGQEDFDKNQFNANGQQLSQTPPDNGAPIANDYSNDNRTSQDLKQQLRQAQQDINSVSPADDTDDDHILMNDGYKMSKVDDSHLATGMEAATAFLGNYLANMNTDMGKAIAEGSAAAGQAVSIHEDKIKRQEMIKNLEAKTDSFGNPLYNSIDLEKWRDTGDTKDLVANAGKWTSDGKGWMHNTLTGQSRQIPGYQGEEKLTKVDLGDRVSFVNPNGVEVHSFDKGIKPGTVVPNSLDSSGDDGTGDQVPEMQNGVYGTRDYKGTFKPLGQKEQVYWRDHAQAEQGNKSPTEIQQNKNIDLLLNAGNDQLEGFTGKADQMLSMDNPYINLNTNQDNRQYLAAAKELEGYMQNQGVGAAKSMGLSGINTLEEARRAFASMPQLDRSSPQAFRDSVKRINEYVTNYNNQTLHNRGVKTTQPSSTNQLSDDDLLKKYGG